MNGIEKSSDLTANNTIAKYGKKKLVYKKKEYMYMYITELIPHHNARSFHGCHGSWTPQLLRYICPDQITIWSRVDSF